MRMTNKIMQNNSLYNINNNKILQDKLSTMMSTQKKITRPSDDPIIAIRALRLRTSVSELTQYYEKNAKNADSWLDVTGKALDTATQVLTDISRRANDAANKDRKCEDLKILLDQIKSLKNEFYSTGNVDYAGRYVFTGFRTDTTMSFTEQVEKDQTRTNGGYPNYTIHEQNTIADFDTINYTDVDKLNGLNKNNFMDTNYDNITEQPIRNGDIHRLRMSYDDLKGVKDATNDITIEMPGTGQTFTATTVPVGENPDPYKRMLDANENNQDLILFVPETGEILFSDTAYSKVETATKAPGAGGTNAEIRVTYDKNTWADGDIRPEHYFACEGTTLDESGNVLMDTSVNPAVPVKINYNQEYLTAAGAKKQAIEYDVGYNQKVQVNTTADEVFSHDLDRDVEDLENALERLEAIDKTFTDMEAQFKSMEDSDPNYDRVKKQYEAASKAYSYERENVHNMFQKMISKAQQYLDDTNVAVTDNGTRSQRLDLISNRLMDQRTTFKTLQSENEDVDIAEVVIQLSSTELTYNAALMATGKIMQTSLMNYI
ncbi:MAG: hypothetical protein K2O16_09685 [Lachnospiraceae bacterium]|nr:hypothetical protein [Lachnospiraceae bacterium]